MRYLFVLITFISMALNAQISIEAPSLIKKDVGIFQVNDNTWEADKQLHVFGSMVLGGVFTFMYQTLGLDQVWAGIIAWGTVMVLGTIKEATDKTGFDFNDMAANGAGAALGVFSAQIIFRINFGNSKKTKAAKIKQNQKIQKRN